MKDQPTKSLHALALYFGANILFLLIDAPTWTYLITSAILLWWIIRWEGDGKEK
jgi:hypothetical protein